MAASIFSSAADALDDEGQRAMRLTQPSANADDAEDEFSFEPTDIPAASAVVAVQNAPTAPVAQAVAVVTPETVAEASSALAAVRAAYAAMNEPSAPQEETQAPNTSSRETLAVGSKSLGAVAEEDEEAEDEDEDEDEEDEEEEAADGEGSRRRTVAAHDSDADKHMGGAVDNIKSEISPLQPMPLLSADGNPMSAEEAALEAEFEAATASALLRVADGAITAPAVPPIKFAEAFAALTDPKVIDPVKSSIVPFVVDPSLGCLGRFLAPTLDAELLPAHREFFCVAKIQYDATSEAHNRIMMHLYTRLAGAAAVSPPNWQAIGFQREGDFTTDLRGCGMLGPLQMLWVVERYPWLASRAMSLGNAPLNPFPVMVQCIGLTAKVLQLMRLGKLIRLCNAERSRTNETAVNPVAVVAHDFFAGLLLNFLQRWEEKNCGIDKIGHVTLASVQWASSSPASVVSALKRKDDEQNGRE
jgi:hypothetical protein